MAINYFNVQAISRNKGHNLIAKVAYNTCTKLNDARTGTKKDYSKKSDEVFSFLIDTQGNNITDKREKYWNSIDKNEKRKDACTGRSITFALPVECNKREHKNFAYDYALFLSKEYDVCVDVSIHYPHKRRKPDANIEAENPHVHIVFADRDSKGEKLRHLSHKQYGEDEVLKMRNKFASLTRRYADNPYFTATKQQEKKLLNYIHEIRKEIIEDIKYNKALLKSQNTKVLQKNHKKFNFYDEIIQNRHITFKFAQAQGENRHGQSAMQRL